MGMLAHLLGIFTWFIGPLIILLVAKDKHKFAYKNAAHAINFQISVTIYAIICALLVLVLIGLLLLPILMIFALVVEIVGSVKAYEGAVYKYPLEIPFIKA
ncbi:DUF4870 domain-containing protein [Candidatus Woesearchaeota archaeon]|nr:DUF4870 domain-containing protein [Candidatus Woesearchaeota archaeon]MBT4368197.1 DUF4870 domain-containing protein [Candidatus Woesearchaeota archaeon]MBT4712686.1 DUF4870 domain-containing protein [Candidatus Woesearchaeota archaeon]MBT6639598.1 DUF4870 domain-containing protein [Candidatus Woesearchaeota archaeon]MBT7133770.1 DUF4870 domain-containing protein [Candidatus Woesearchaeota archaeon]